MSARLYLLLALLLHVGLAGAFSYEDEEDDEDYEDFSNVTSIANGTLSFVRQLQNVTRPAGRVAKLQCEVQDSATSSRNDTGAGTRRVTFTWRRHGGLVERDGRVSVRTYRAGAGEGEQQQQQQQQRGRSRSVLRVQSADPVLDSGWYECSATNGPDVARSRAFLHVLDTPGPGGSTMGNTLKFDDMEEESDIGESITFVPNLHLSKIGRDFSTMSDVVSAGGGGRGGGVERNAVDDPATKRPPPLPPLQFDLSATGRMVSGRGPGASPPSGPGAAAAGSQLPPYNASQPLCQPYRGLKCKAYLENQRVFVQPPYTQANIEKKLEDAFLVISQSQDISSSCSRFAQPSLCYSAFPICTDAGRIGEYQREHGAEMGARLRDRAAMRDVRVRLTRWMRRICRSDCVMLETELCSKEYAIAKRHPVLGQPLELEECEYLPEGESAKNCLSLGVDIELINQEDNCYWDEGRLYRGTKDVSVTEEPCLRWAYQFHIPLSEHPELTGHNYCRNPGGMEKEPFCYVDQNRREVCGIRKCASVVTVYVIVTFVLSLVAVIAVAYVCCRRKHKAARNLQNMNTPMASKNIYGNPGPNSPMELNNLLPVNIPPPKNHHHHHPTKGSYQNVAQYTYKELTFVEELGEGAFGKVYKGELKTKSGKMFVAVKSLKENASAKTQADFQREIELISELKHPNIICLVGVVTKQEPVCMLFEFMSEGDLHEFLMAHSPTEGRALTQQQFLQVAVQIAQGMEYLSDNHYVHRDLAARNCLVSGELTVKISDFGLSRDMYSCDYYRVQSKSLLPVRWMPPESILYGKFTTESDVWSYGVVLWEIYSYGLQPYYGYNNQEVIGMIRSRRLLPCPDACPSYCYALMVECWAELAVRRPSFAEITYRLRVWRQNGSSNGAYFKTPENYPGAQQQQQQTAGGTGRFGHSSRSGHGTPDSAPALSAAGVCPTVEATPEHSLTWERQPRAGAQHRHESQSSLASHCSSLGNRTQSTSLSADHKPSPSSSSSCAQVPAVPAAASPGAPAAAAAPGKKEKRPRRRHDDHAKNTVIVSSTGAGGGADGGFETKITL